MKKWYEKTFVWAQTNLTEDDAGKKDISFWKNYWKENGIEGVIINCSGIVTYYRTERKNQRKARFLGKEDCFGLWNQAAREAGLSVVARMDMNVTEKEMAEEHPEWYCRDKNGSFILSQGRYVTCINGDYYREFIPSVLKEVIETYGPDGFTDNNWSGLRRDTICYCSNCRKKFREMYQEELPQDHDWDNPVYRKWVAWGYETRVAMWDYLNQMTAEYGGENCIWAGMLNADPTWTRGQYYDVRKLTKRSKIIFLDNQSREEEGGFEQNSVFGNLIHAMVREGTIVTESMSQYYRGIRTFRLTAASPGESRLWSLAGISAGISPWYHFIGGGTLDSRKFGLSDDILAWYRENLSSLVDRRNMAGVAVLWNQETFIYYGQDEGKERCLYPWIGMTRALTQSGIPIIPLHTSDVENYRDRITAYILPNIAVMNDEEICMILEEMRAGKNFVITGSCGSFGEHGEKRKINPILRKLGLEEQNRKVGCIGLGSADWGFDESHNYLKVVSEKHPILRGLEDTSILPFGGSIEVVENRGKLEKVVSYIPSFPIYPPEFSWIRQESEIGGIYAGEVEKHGRVVYLAADIDRCYGKYQLPDHKRILSNAVKWAAQGTIPVTLETEGSICCNGYWQKEVLLIHLVNLTGSNVALGTLEAVVPLHDVVAELDMSAAGGGNAGKVKCITGLVGNYLYHYEQAEGKIRIEIPVLREHELLKVEWDYEA